MSFHHLEWGNLVQLYRFLCIEAARDHSKSFTFSFEYPLWKLYRYRRENFGIRNYENLLNKKGMIITNEHSLAKDFLKIISDEVESNPILREKIYCKNTWGKEEITTQQGAELKVKGAGSALRGRHPGWMVIDDFLNDEVLYSPIQNTKYNSFFQSVIMNMIVPKGQIIVVGTPYTENDLYSVLKKDKRWRVFEYPAIFPDGRLLWPTRYTLQEILDKKESQGNIIFSREILVRPIASDSSIFPWKILETSFINMGEIKLVENFYSHPMKFKKIVMGCDFAISSEVGADYSVFTTIGIDDLDNYWLLNQWTGKGVSYNEQIAKMKELYRNFKHNLIMCEDNAFQSVMLGLAKEAGIKVVPHTTGVNKYDLKTGLPGLATLFEQGRMKLPRGDEYSKNVSNEICTQLNSFTFMENKIKSVAQHDDQAMSIWIAVKAASYVTKNFNYGFL
jgi:phage terminase large subunit-like protein